MSRAEAAEAKGFREKLCPGKEGKDEFSASVIARQAMFWGGIDE